MPRMAAFLALVVTLISAAPQPAGADLAKLDPLARRALERVRSGATVEALRASQVAVSESRDLDVFIVGPVSRAALEAAGARVRTALPGVTTAYMPANAVESIAAIPDVVRIHGAAMVSSLLNVSVPTTAASYLRGAGPDFVGLNGSGVIVGDVDSGVDYDHPDFRKPDGSTRLINIWDQTDTGGPNPAGFVYGAEWTAADINSHLVREADFDGHGTHVLGTLGGDGSGTGGAVPAYTYVGMAPKADLIMVKCNYTDTGVVDGVAYIMGRATALGKNAVVNLSLGTMFGPKDGTSPFEAAIGALAGPGHIIVCAAGNSGNSDVHAEVAAPSGGSASASMLVSNSGEGAFIGIDGYYPAVGNLNVTIITPVGTAVGPVALGAANAPRPGVLTANGNVYVENGLSLTANGDREVYAELTIPNPNFSGANLSGTWVITFSSLGPALAAGTSHDESTEDHTGSQWNAGTGSAATPGLVSGASGTHLLITEVGWRGLNSPTLTDSTEFIEIYNPTGALVDLTNYYLADVNGYAALPVAGNVNLAANNTDFAMRFPVGAVIGPGQAKVVAIDGGRFQRGTGVDADFMFFNAGGTTTGSLMVDVGTNKGGTYPAFGSLTNGGEFVELYSWDGLADLVCDVDLVYWGAPTGANIYALKQPSQCQDGPDAGASTSCYLADIGNPAGAMSKGLAVPASGAGTRQRIGVEGIEGTGGNGCPVDGGGGSSTAVDLWTFDTNVPASYVVGNRPDRKLVVEPANAPDVITVGAWVSKIQWVDCAGFAVHYIVVPPVGALTTFSSPGPTRDGREKPDITAPGMGIASSVTYDIPVYCANPSRFVNDNLQHVVGEGTSFAAPHVSGAAALLLQKNGAMTPAQVKTFLYSRAILDANTGSVWNNRWGHGKLFLGDLTDPIARVLVPNGGEIVAVDAIKPMTWSAADIYLGVTSVDLLLSRDDGATFESMALGVANTGTYDWTVTGPVTHQARLRVVAHDAAGNAGSDLSDTTFSIVTGPLGVPVADVITDYSVAIRSSNPSRGLVDMEYAVPRASEVNVSVYDLSGRRVATLASGTSTQGRHRIQWNGRGSRRPAAGGVYFVRLVAPGRDMARRIVLAP